MRDRQASDFAHPIHILSNLKKFRMPESLVRMYVGMKMKTECITSSAFALKYPSTAYPNHFFGAFGYP